MITYSRLGKMGRFGNQLFQVAATLALAAEHGDKAVFPHWEYDYAFKRHVEQISDFSWVKSIYQEPRFEHTSIKYTSSMDLGASYLQSEKYFAGHKDLIRAQFDFVDGLVSEDRLKSVADMCSIHVRRTDYLKFADYHPFPGMRYYEQAIEEMEARGICNFAVFSDDISWCESAFGNDRRFTYIKGQTNVQDMYLMSRCHSNIMANSSYSWWGAWLNKNESKLVIAPSQWFGPASEATPKDLYCDGWIVI